MTAPEHGPQERAVVQRDLVIQAQHGDVEAFRVLVTGAIDRLRGVAYRILGDGDRADDATQQALIDAWDHLGSLRDPDRFDAWTYRLVVHASYHEARRARSWRAAVTRLTALSEVDSWADPPAAVIDHEELARAFAQLSPEHRAVLALRYYADLPLARIADVLDIPVGTVGSRLHNALARLRTALDGDPRPATLLEQTQP